LARVQVINIEQPVEIYELVCDPPADWEALRERYEQALTTLENQNVGSARQLAKTLAADFPNDRATKALLGRIDSAQVDPETPTDTSIWCLPGK